MYISVNTNKLTYKAMFVVIVPFNSKQTLNPADYLSVSLPSIIITATTD